MWFWSSGVPFWRWQEDVVREFPPRVAAEYPMADAIVDLGGGMGCRTYALEGGKELKVAEMSDSADRVWYSAQLWKAGKAPVVMPSTEGAENADAVLLEALGVPKEAILVEGAARNTEENAKRIVRLFDCSDCSIERLSTNRLNSVSEKKNGNMDLQSEQSTNPNNRKIRILLVTSAWHMKRSLLMFRKYAPELEVIPAPTDHSGMGTRDFELLDLLPSAGGFMWNNVFLHEVIGYWWYRICR